MQSADELYQQARQRWLEVIDLSVYDDQDIIYGTTSIWEKALRQDSTHLKSLTLLTQLVMQLGACEEAKETVDKLKLLDT